MTRFSLLIFVALFCQSLQGQTTQDTNSSNGNRVTILYDAFGNKQSLTPDWGYAALVEFEGKRILFDTGNNAAILENNVKRMHVDLSRLDMVVLSHRHGDHTSGLHFVLAVNKQVPVYAPRDEPFLDKTPAAFFSQGDAKLPAKMRYFGGTVPSPVPAHGTTWPGIAIHTVESLQEIAPHIRLVATMSETPGFRDMPELSLVLDTTAGPIVIVGCSHPGIENILANVTELLHRTTVYEVVGGMHLLVSTPTQVEKTVSAMLERYQVKRVAAGHCTGEQAFALLQERLGPNYIYAGLGQTLPLP
jgi:7,8-dihydropterin-6-yl-methyl-4-(beta-D-ribofuranosyl)aminobenzene 5'-phosphate synthase